MLALVITQRPGTDLADLRSAESVLTGAWLDASAFVASHPGDLECWYASVAPGELAEHLRLWSTADGVRAWSWVHGHLVHWEIRPSDPTTDEQLLDAILRAAVAEIAGRVEAWVPEDDAATLATLDRLGFRPRTLRLSQFQRRVDDGAPIADAILPAGYRLRHLAGPDEIPARAAIHRAAFPSSTMTAEQYTRLTTLPTYRFEDDLVVEAPDRSLAAFAIAWWDPVAGVGEFEPVGTHPDHRRLGLARTLLGHGLGRYREREARMVQVYALSDNLPAEALYPAAGFVRRRHRLHFERPAEHDAAWEGQ
jgi:ribosomal protein S18 acetylase RimI-like enzyme